MVANKNRWTLGLGGSVLAAAVSWTASADTTVIPNLMFTLGAGSNTYTYEAASIGNAWGNGNSTFGYAGMNTPAMDSSNGFSFAWNLLVNPDPFIIGNIVVTNTSNATQEFMLLVSLPINDPIAQTYIGGSITGTVTDLNGDGATLAAVNGGSIYTAMTDVTGITGNIAGTLLTGTSVSAGSFLSANIGPASFGDPIPNQLYGAVTTNIAIMLKFTLTAGDSASFTSIFVVEPVPAPGALALLGLAGLAAGSRRRR